MPYNRPGPGVYVTNGNTATLQHGDPVVVSNYVGVAVKQRARSWRDGFDVQATIDRLEPFYILTDGIVMVPVTGISSPAVGDAVYITSANALTKTNTGNTPYGRITELAGTRGVPTGFVRIDLDIKTAVAAAAF